MAYIRIKNGSTGGLPTSLLTGEPAYSINDNKTYIGNGSSVVRLDAGSYTAECTTAAATAAKVATCPGIILIKGVEVTVKFTEDNTVAPASLTLNINNTGAWPILYRGSSLPSASVLSANRVYKFYYNGTSWELIGDLDTTVGAALSSHTGNSTIHITSTERINWNAAYGWGDHASVGYLTAITKSQVEAVLTGSITSHTHSYALLAGSTTQNFSAKNLTLAGTITGASTIEANSYISKRASYTIPRNSPGWYRIATYTPAGGDQAMNGVLLVNTKYYAAYPEAYKVLVSGIYNTPRVTILESNVNGANNTVTKFRVTTYKVGAYTWSYAVDVYWSLDSASPQTLQVASIGTLTSQTPVLYTTFDTDGHSQSVEIDIIPNVSSFVGGISATSITASSTIQATTAKLTNLSNGYLPYHVSDASGLANSPIYTDGANVGIGTTAPEVIFQIGEIHQYGEERVLIAQPNNPINERGILNIVSSDAPGIDVGGSLSFGGSYANNFETAWASIAGRKENDNSVNYAGYLQFGTRVHGSPIQEQMRITSTGNVGIGYTDPGTYKLKVNGTGYFNSNLTVGGTLGVTGNTTLSGTLGVTGATTLATATVTNQLNFESSSSGKWINYYGSASLYDVTAFNLSIKHETPFIDFYFETKGVFDGENWVGSSRIIERDAGVLDIEASVKIPSSKYWQIGDARLTYETVGGVGFLKLAHSNPVTPMHLVTTGGQTMYSTGVPATGGGGGATILLNGTTYGEGSTATIYSPTSIGYPGYILKAANPSGLPVWDSITNLLPDASTSVKGVAMLAGSGSATTVARSDHNHTGVYAAASHGHATLLYTELRYTDIYSDTHNVLGYSGTSEYDITLGNDTYKTIINGSPIVLEPFISYTGLVKCTNGTLSVDTNTYLTGITKSMVDAVSCNADTVDNLHAASFLRSDAANSSDIAWSSVSGMGIRFWNDEKYKIFMAATANTTYGNRMSGDTTSDYNMYFRIGDGTNRGFVFESSYSVKLASINPDGIRTLVPLTVRSTETSFNNSQFILGNATIKYLAASNTLEYDTGIAFTAGVINGAVIGNYGVCSTAESIGAKTVTISGFRLATGVQINVKFSNNNYAYPMTLNVSNTGAKTVKAYGDNDEQYFLEQIQAGAIVPFVYDGTYWVIPTTPSMY